MGLRFLLLGLFGSGFQGRAVGLACFERPLLSSSDEESSVKEA